MQLLLTVFLFGLAFVVLPFGTSWHEIPKVVLSLLCIALLSGVFFWQQSNWKKISLSHASLFFYGGLFATSLWSLIAAWTPIAFFGNPFRLQGILTLWALLLWSITSPYQKLHKKISIVAWVSLILTLIVSIYGQLDAAGRAVGSVGEANSLGAYVLFLAPLTTSLFALVPGLIVLVLSGSRSALVGLLAALSIWIGAKKFSLTLCTIVAVSILITSLCLPLFDTKQSNDNRADIWKTAIEAGREKPILGWGIGNTEIGLKAAAQTAKTTVRFQYVDSSHNVFLDWWVQGGIVGFLLFSGIVALTVIDLVQKEDTVLLASFLGMLAVMMFNPVSIAILVPFWWIVGQCLSQAKINLRNYT